MQVRVPLQHADWTGSVWRAGVELGGDEVLFDPDDALLTTTLRIGGTGVDPFAGVDDQVRLLP